MLIRPATQADVDALHTLQETCFPRILWEDRVEISRSVEQDVHLVAVDDGFVVGSGSARVNDGYWHVYAVEVRVTYRRRGIGSALVAALLAAQPSGMRATAYAIGFAGVRLLRAAGFSRRGGTLVEGMPAVLMELPCAPLQTGACAPPPGHWKDGHSGDCN